MRSVVVLPQPDGPSRQANSPCRTSKERFSQRRDRDALRRLEGLFGDVDPKRDAGANGLHIVQRAAPGEVR